RDGRGRDARGLPPPAGGAIGGGRLARREGRPELCLLERLAAGPEERCSLPSRPTTIKPPIRRHDVGRLTAHARFPLLTWSASRSRDRSHSLAERFAMRVDVDNHGGGSAVAHQFKTSRGTTPNPGPVGTWTRPSW